MTPLSIWSIRYTVDIADIKLEHLNNLTPKNHPSTLETKQSPPFFNVFGVPESHFSTASFDFVGQAPRTHFMKITNFILWLTSVPFLGAEIDLIEVFQSL